MRKQRQDVRGCTPLEKDRTYILNPILPTHPKYSFTIPFFIYVTFLISFWLPGYTLVVEWVLGRPAEL